MHFQSVILLTGTLLLAAVEPVFGLPGNPGGNNPWHPGHHGHRPVLRQVKKFKHPGALHTTEDFTRIKAHLQNQEQPWVRAFSHLESRPLANPTRKPTPLPTLIRGRTDVLVENYGAAYRDAHSAYQQAIRWHLTGNDTYANSAIRTLDAWSSTLTKINGSEDRFLAAGLYGYQFANAAELLTQYTGWPAANKTAFGTLLTNVFAPLSIDFLINHNGKPDFYYANWDLCNIASLMAIGTFTNNASMFNWATTIFTDGLPNRTTVINGALPYFSIANFTEEGSGKELMQGQEAGRDQGHALLCFALLAVIGEQGKNQGVDTYGLFGNQILNGAEYAAKFNTNHSVPYVPYRSWEGILPVVSEKFRFNVRPGFEAIYSHYSELKGLNASYSGAFRDFVNKNLTANIEGGGGDYGPNSGGFDHLGHGTLLYRRTKDA